MEKYMTEETADNNGSSGLQFQINYPAICRQVEYLDSTLLFANAGGFSTKATQIIELGAPDASFAHALDLRNLWRVQREYPFDANAVGDLSNGERLAGARTAKADHHALKLLNTFFLALDNANMDVDGVSWLKGRDVVFDLGGLNKI